jgi:hypothetical protein
MDVSIFKGSWVTWDIDRGGSMRRLVALLKNIFIMKCSQTLGINMNQSFCEK